MCLFHTLYCKLEIKYNLLKKGDVAKTNLRSTQGVKTKKMAYLWCGYVVTGSSVVYCQLTDLFPCYRTIKDEYSWDIQIIQIQPKNWFYLICDYLISKPNSVFYYGQYVYTFTILLRHSKIDWITVVDSCHSNSALVQDKTRSIQGINVQLSLVKN